MAGEDYAISVEINDTYPDGSFNPNVGRPYAAGNGVADSETTDRTASDSRRRTNSTRTAFLEEESMVSKILGRMASPVYSTRRRRTSERSTGTRMRRPPLGRLLTEVRRPGSDGSNLRLARLHGPNLLGSSSTAGTNIKGIQTVISPVTLTAAKYFVPTYANTWVNPDAPFSFTATPQGLCTSAIRAKCSKLRRLADRKRNLAERRIAGLPSARYRRRQDKVHLRQSRLHLARIPI